MKPKCIFGIPTPAIILLVLAVFAAVYYALVEVTSQYIYEREIGKIIKRIDDRSRR